MNMLARIALHAVVGMVCFVDVAAQQAAGDVEVSLRDGGVTDIAFSAALDEVGLAVGEAQAEEAHLFVAGSVSAGDLHDVLFSLTFPRVVVAEGDQVSEHTHPDRLGDRVRVTLHGIQEGDLEGLLRRVRSPEVTLRVSDWVPSGDVHAMLHRLAQSNAVRVHVEPILDDEPGEPR